MAQHSHVPKFGNWESEENVPYTAYFDKARKGRTGGKMINPNDPQENPDLVPEYNAPAQASLGAEAALEEPTGHGAVRRAHESRRSREDGDQKQFADSPARHDNMNRRNSSEAPFADSPARRDNTNRRNSSEAAAPRYGSRGPSAVESQKRPARQSAGSENSMERSPLHPHARISGRGGGAPSPSWEGRGSYESSHGTPGRSRLRPKGDESPDNSAAVPKFGEWDETNPSAADGYTHIFNKVREEKQSGAGKVPGMRTEQSQGNAPKQTPSDSSKSCCFCWPRK